MLIKFTGGKVYDPMNGVNGEIRDIYAKDGRIVAAPPQGTRIDQEYSLNGRVVMAGAIDPHSHIGGGKVTIGRMLLPEDHQGHEVARTDLTRSGCGHAVPSTMTTGYRYAEMGYTAAFEPAMLPANARQAHLEMGDTPMIDKGAFVMLGNDDFFLRTLVEKKDFSFVKDYIAFTIQWDHSTGDPAPSQSAKAIAAAMLRSVKPGSIIIAHANGRGYHTSAALPLAIPALRAKGFEFVTVSELLAAGTPEIVQSCYDSHPGDTDRYDHLLALKHPPKAN
jgi:amidohydrolase family protein